MKIVQPQDGSGKSLKNIKNAVANSTGVANYGNGAIYKFNDWDGTDILQGSADLTSGTLTIGKFYKIKTFETGDDFSNIGGNNVSGTKFIATGTTPATWDNSSVLYEVGHAVPVPYKNSLSNVFTGFEVIGWEGTGSRFRVQMNTGFGLHWIKSRTDTKDNNISDLNMGRQSFWSSNTSATQEKDADYIEIFNYDNFIDYGDGSAIANLGDSFISWNWHYPCAKAWHANGAASRKVPTPWGIKDSVESNASSGITGDQVVMELYNPLTGNGCLLYVGNETNRVFDISGGITPEFMFGKTLSESGSPTVYSAYSNGGPNAQNYYLQLHSTLVEQNNAVMWRASPTPTTISTGVSTTVNNTALQIIYYFSPVAGLQNFGGYEGTDGVNNQATGCKDGMFFAKSRIGVGGWYIFDSLRGSDNYLFWNAANVEGAVSTVSFNTDAGIDMTTGNVNPNNSSNDYIYGHFGKEMVPQGDISVFPTISETSNSANNNVEIYFKYKGSASIEEGSEELFIDASREASPNWVNLNIEKISDIDTEYQLLRAYGNISSNAAGTDMRWRLRTVETVKTQHDIEDLDISWT